MLPVQVALPGPCSLLSSGYFHCIAGLAAGGLVVWGSNPQVLRLEAQQRKKERQAARKAEERRQEEEEVERGLREAAEDDGSCIAVEEELHSSSFPSISQPLVDPASEAHLVAQVVAVPSEVGPVASVACGSQHSVILSRAGRLYAFEHSLEGQLGVGSRPAPRRPPSSPQAQRTWQRSRMGRGSQGTGSAFAFSVLYPPARVVTMVTCS